MVLISLTTVISGGCLQLSLSPLFTADEAVFDEHLVGQWVCGNESWTFRRADGQDVPAGAYDVDIKAGAKSVAFVALLGRLGNDAFITFTSGQLDDASTSPFVKAHVVTGFTFGRVTLEGDRLRLAMLNSDWIARTYRAGLLGIGANRIWPGAGADDVDVILTSGPADLQRFARAYADDAAVFSERIRFRRVGSTAPARATAGRDPGETCYEG